jgi:hypothetical protein
MVEGNQLREDQLSHRMHLFIAIDPQPPEILVDGPVNSQNISLKFRPSPLNKREIL